MTTPVNVCQRMISIWSIWYTGKYSLSTLSLLKRVNFIIWKHLMRKGYMVILMYHYSHRFVQHASADIFLQRYLRHCKRQTQSWKSSSNGVERIFCFPCSLPYWMPALLRTAKNILRASWKNLQTEGKKIRAYGAHSFPLIFSTNLPCFNGSRSSTFPGVNMKLRISPLSLIIWCSLNPKNHLIEYFPRSASPSNVLWIRILWLRHTRKGVESTKLMPVQVTSNTFLIKMVMGCNTSFSS